GGWLLTRSGWTDGVRCAWARGVRRTGAQGAHHRRGDAGTSRADLRRVLSHPRLLGDERSAPPGSGALVSNRVTAGAKTLESSSPAGARLRGAHLIRFPELYTTERGEPVLARSARLCITRRRRNLCRRNNWPRRGHRQAHLTPRGSCQEL